MQSVYESESNYSLILPATAQRSSEAAKPLRFLTSRDLLLYRYNLYFCTPETVVV